MTTPFLYTPTFAPVFNGGSVPNGLLYTYEAGTTNPKPTFADAAGLFPNGNPVMLDITGAATVRLETGAYHFVLRDASNSTTIWDQDFYNAPYLTATDIANLLYPMTVSEVNAGIVPSNPVYPPGKLLRHGANTLPGTTDMAPAFQTAIDLADASNPAISFADTCTISTPLLIRPGSVEGLAIKGDSRTICIIEPKTIDISVTPQSTNALIFNQCDNGHLQLKDLRFLSEVPYTGHILYCKEGGGLDGSGQALFSAVMDNLWCSLSSQNAGYFRGGFSNLKATHFVYESVKDACWILEGAGNGDLQFIGHQMFICFDNFIRASDTFDKSLIVVNNLTAYSHQRGRLIEVNKGHKLIFNNILMEPDAANLGDCGLFKLTDCDNVLVSNFSMTARTGVPGGAVGIDIINSCSGQFVNGAINATTGIQFSGSGAIDLEFTNVDFSNCSQCVSFLTGTFTGHIRWFNCKFNNAQLQCIVQSAGSASLDMDFYGCEILNAGLGGVTSTRNIDWAGSGNVNFYGCKIGQNNGTAAAAYYISYTGSGVLRVIDPDFIGTPPTGLTVGSSTTDVLFRKGYGGVLASAATLVLPNYGDVFLVSGTTNITSIAAQQGRRITLIFQGALTFTDGSNLALAGNLVTTTDDTISLHCVGGTWYETGRSVN